MSDVEMVQKCHEAYDCGGALTPEEREQLSLGSAVSGNPDHRS